MYHPPPRAALKIKTSKSTFLVRRKHFLAASEMLWGSVSVSANCDVRILCCHALWVYIRAGCSCNRHQSGCFFPLFSPGSGGSSPTPSSASSQLARVLGSCHRHPSVPRLSSLLVHSQEPAEGFGMGNWDCGRAEPVSHTSRFTLASPKIS